MSFSASSVQAAATIALVDGIAGMMFFVTPCVSWYVTPCEVNDNQVRALDRASVGGRDGQDDVLCDARDLVRHALRSKEGNPGFCICPDCRW